MYRYVHLLYYYDLNPLGVVCHPSTAMKNYKTERVSPDEAKRKFFDYTLPFVKMLLELAAFSLFHENKADSHTSLKD